MKFIDIVRIMGGRVDCVNNAFIAQKSQLSPLNFNVEQMIDCAPILAVSCSFANGTSVLSGVDRLRFKESDRLEAIIQMVNNIGGEAFIENGNIVINGNPNAKGGVVDGKRDHRIVMSAVVAGAFIGNVTVDGVQAVNKSYPDFFKHFSQVGGSFYVDGKQN